MRWLALAYPLVGSLLFATSADARSEKQLGYTREQAWPAAVRFLRVDAHLKVVEKDADAGYVLFELREEGKTFHGALEVVDVTQGAHHSVRLVLTIEDRPQYMEIQLLDHLEHKLHVELGSPPPPPPAKKPEPPAKPDPAKPDPGKGGSDDGPPISPTP
jgi:hypothetical protein